jgi:phage shock protein C
MYCWNCGKQLEDAANYCSACGAARSGYSPAGVGFGPPRAFRRIREGKKIAGVCGGVARYFDLDVTLVRILWVLLTICPPIPGLVAYIVCWIVMPQDPLPTASSPATASAVPPHADAGASRA